MSLVQEIEVDLRAHLSHGKVPCHLTLKALADHYDVSQTPIISVVEILIKDQVLLKQSNGRLVVNPKKVGKMPLKFTSVEKVDHYEQILRDIVLKSLSAEQEFLREESTAAHHGLSRSAVREIFHQISGQGILEHIPRRGWRIRPFTQDDLDAFIEAREALELRALELAKGKLLDIDLQSMYDGNIPPKRKKDRPVIDNRIHEYIIEKADNFYISDFFKRHAPFFKILFEFVSPVMDNDANFVKIGNSERLSLINDGSIHSKNKAITLEQISTLS